MDRGASLAGYCPWGLKESDMIETHRHKGMRPSIQHSVGKNDRESCHQRIQFKNMRFCVLLR